MFPVDASLYFHTFFCKAGSAAFCVVKVERVCVYLCVCACVCGAYVCVCVVRTGSEQLACAQEADGQPHDGGLVQVRADAVWQRQLVGQVVEHLRLFAAAAASRVARLLLTPLRAGPAIQINTRKLRKISVGPSHSDPIISLLSRWLQAGLRSSNHRSSM